MKSKISAAIVILSSYFCVVVSGQNNPVIKNDRDNDNTNAPVKNTGTKSTTLPKPNPAAPQLDLNGNLLSQKNLQVVLNQVAKSKEFQNLKKNVTTKVNNSKVGKKASGFRNFLYRIGLAKKPVVPKKTTK